MSAQDISMATKMKMKVVLKELASVELQLMKLRSMLLPTERLSKKELAKLKKAEREIGKGHWTNGEQLIKKLSS